RLKAGSMAKYSAKFHVFRWSERFQYGPLVKELHLDQLGSRQNLETGIELVLLNITDRCLQFVDQQLDPEFCDLMLDDERHFIVVRRTGKRPLLGEQAIKAEVARIAHPILEIGDDASFQRSL